MPGKLEVLVLSIAVEKEVKFRIPSWDEGERRLATAGGSVREPRHFESNSLFDFPDRVLENRGEALRLRRSGSRAWLTFKGPVHGRGRIKQRHEYETSLGDPTAVEIMLQALGLEEHFRYEKYRAVYFLSGLAVMLDETPIGFFLEIEGTRENIEAAADKLGLRMQEACSITYPQLYQQYRDQKPRAPEFMVFPQRRKLS
ncbi:MAG: class IV adenylate cyclase [Acidobacteriota bacterium]